MHKKDTISYSQVSRILSNNGCKVRTEEGSKIVWSKGHRLIFLEKNKNIDFEHFTDLCETILEIGWWEIDYLL